MPNPTTYQTTQPGSPRIGQSQPTTATVLNSYPANNFPPVAYPNQLAIDSDTHTLAWFNGTTGAWQQVPGADNIQAFYEATQPTSGMNPGDQWYNTANDNSLSYYNGSGWVSVPFGSNAIANVITGKTIQTNVAPNPRWVLSGGGFSEVLYGYSGEPTETNPAQFSISQSGISGVHQMFITMQAAYSNAYSSGYAPAYLQLVSDGTVSGTNVASHAALSAPGSIGFTAGYAGGGNAASIGLDANGIQFGGAGSYARCFSMGSQGSATTDASGNVVVTHTLNATPVHVSLTNFTGTNGVGVRLAAKGATTFTANFYDTNTKASLATTNVGFTWQAWA